VACGGDGTINEVASCLTGTTIPLGINNPWDQETVSLKFKFPKNIKKKL